MRQMSDSAERQVVERPLLQVLGVVVHRVTGLHQVLTRGPTKGQRVVLHRPTIHTRPAVERGRIAEHRVKA